MGAAVLPHFQTSRRSGLVSLARSCASRPRVAICPASVAPPATAAAKKPKRTGDFRDVEPPAKRTCREGEHAAAAAAAKKPKLAGSFRCEEPPAPKRVRGEGDRDYASGTSKIKNRPSPCTKEGPTSSAFHRAAAAFMIKNQASSASPTPSLILQKASMSELIAKARVAKAAADASSQGDIERRRAEIAQMRAEARRELEQMVATVEFNDPYIDPTDVLK